MTVKAVIGAMVLAVGVGVGAYGYYAPILAMQGMHAAAEQRDADTFAVGMVFVRHGLFDWKLTELRLPAGFVQ